MKKLFVLDACALIALLNNEDGADIVEKIYDEAYTNNITIMINKVNLLEVYYGYYKADGKKRADYFLTQYRKHPVVKIGNITNDLFIEAGRLKANYKISLADSIAAAQALVSKGILLTADYEFKALENAKEPIVFKWIRPKKRKL